MQIVEELSKIITPKRVKHVNLISFKIGKDSKLLQFYEGLRKGKFSSDQDAVLALYGNLDAKYKYSKLKYDLRKRLYNTLHLVKLDAKEVGDARKTFIECQKIWTTVYFLIFFNAKKSAINLLEKYFPKMLKYEFTIMVLEAAKILRQHYSVIDLDRKRVDCYDKIVKDYLQLYVEETTIEGYFHDVISYFVQSKSQQASTLKLADSYLEQVDISSLAISSSQMIFRYRMIEVIKYMSQYDFDTTISICNTAIQELESKDIPYHPALMIIKSQAVSCHMQLGRYSSARNICKSIIEYHVVKGDFNWFKANELNFQIEMHSHNYATACAVYRNIINHKNFKNLPVAIREEWKIYRAFIELLILTKGINTMNHELPPFKLGRFLNEINVFSRDKKGYNISVLVAQITILLAQKRYNKLIDRMEGIEKYVSRHLQSEYHYRSKCFFRIVSLICRAGFDKNMIDWDAINKTEEKLRSKSINIINPNYDVEIIKYEFLIIMLKDNILSSFD